MRMTYLAHACILVEAAGARIVMDPWLYGPAQYHSWCISHRCRRHRGTTLGRLTS